MVVEKRNVLTDAGTSIASSQQRSPDLGSVQQSPLMMLDSNAVRRQRSGALRRGSALKIAILTLAVLGGSLSSKAVAQTFCACTPSIYQFRLSFNLTCDDTSFALSQSITDIQCTTTPSDAVLDTTTAEAYNIQFVELDQNRLVLKSTTIDAPEGNGAIVSYESYIANPDPGDTRVPGSLQVGITARDATTSTVFQQWVLQYSNSCDGLTYPVVDVGQQIGWTVVANTTPPSASYCPAISGGNTTRAPTVSPSNVTNTTSAPVSAPPISPAPVLGAPTAAPVAFSTNPATPRPSAKVPVAPTPSLPTKPVGTSLPTVACPPYIWSKGGKGKGKGSGGFGANLFDRAFIPTECYEKSSKSSKSKEDPKDSKSKKGASKSTWGKGMFWPTPAPGPSGSSSSSSKSVSGGGPSSKWGKGKGGGDGPSSKWGKGKGWAGWPTVAPGPHAIPPDHHPSPNAHPSPVMSPSEPMVPSTTAHPSWQYSPTAPSVPSAPMVPTIPTPTDDLFLLTPTLPPGPPSMSSTGPQAALADDRASQPPQSDDPSVPVESAEPGTPTQPPAGGGGTTSQTQAAAVAGIVVAGVAVTALATVFLVRSTGGRGKPNNNPVPPMIGGSRMSTGGESLSVDSRPPSSSPPGAAAVQGRGQRGHAAAERRLSSTLATGFQEGPILEETVPMMMFVPPPTSPILTRGSRNRSTGAAMVSSVTADGRNDADYSPLMVAEASSISAARGLDAPPADRPPLATTYRDLYSSSPVPPPVPSDAEYLSRRWTRVSLGDPEGDTVDDSDASHMMVD